MTVAVDRMTEFVLKSVQVFLKGHLVGPGKDYSGVWLAHQDFRHDVDWDPNDPAREVERRLPYVVIEYVDEETVPFHLGNRLVQRNIAFQLLVACESYEAFLRRPQQVQQLLESTGLDGMAGAIPLLDFEAGSPPPVAGRFEVWTGRIMPFLDIDSKREWRNLKFVGMLSCGVEREKLREARLIAS